MYIQDQEEKKAKDREETRLFLKIQIEEARARRDKEFRENKEKIRTHFGPEEDPFTADFQRNLDNHKKSMVMDTLQRQITENSNFKNTKKEVERREDLQHIARAGEVMYEEHKENSAKDKGRKELFKKTWLMQDEVKRQEKQINDELLRLPHQRASTLLEEGDQIKPPYNTLLV